MGRQIPFSENKMTMFRKLTQDVYEIKTSFVHVIYHIPATVLTDKDNPGSVSFVPDPTQEKKLPFYKSKHRLAITISPGTLLKNQHAKF